MPLLNHNNTNKTVARLGQRQDGHSNSAAALNSAFQGMFEAQITDANIASFRAVLTAIRNGEINTIEEAIAAFKA